MRCPFRFRGFLLVASLSLIATVTIACGSGETAEANANAALAVTFSQTYLTIENHTGVPLVDGEIQIIPRGVMPPFRTSLPRIEGSGKVDMTYSRFYSRDGTPFRRGAVRARTVRIAATDVTGKKIEQEVEYK